MLKKTDRTKRAYCEALLDLCEKMPLAKITVTDLVRETQTARQTFYNNFRDINDLISYIPINYLETSEKALLSVDNLRHAYEYALQHRGFFRALPSHAGQNNFRDTFVAWLEQNYYERFIAPDADKDERLRRKLAIDLFVMGITDQFLEWCSLDFAWPLEMLISVQDESTPDFAKQAGSPR